MKLRIRGNSIRLRLLQNEVKTLMETGRVVETTVIGQNVLSYAIMLGNVEQLSAEYLNNELCITMNSDMCANWHKNDVVGYDYTMQNADGSTLFILIEKDFVCLDDTIEDQSDNYPNPKSNC